MRRHVFLSYVRENAAVVDRLVKDLQVRGVSVWLDRDRFSLGSDGVMRSRRLFAVATCSSPVSQEIISLVTGRT